MTAVANYCSNGVLARNNWILGLVFLYFFTTSADLLHIEISLFRCKFNHAIALLLFLLFTLERKKWVLPGKKFLFATLATMIVMVISGAMAAYPYRSLMYVLVYIFTFVVYFFLPFNLIVAYGKETIFKLYFAAFVATGIFGALQFFLSFFGIYAPFVTQFVAGTIARGQAMSYEPSYFALFMIPYTMFYNARFIFDADKILDFSRLRKLFWQNLLLLISTSTGAFYSYFFFLFFIALSITFTWIKNIKKQIFNKLVKVSALFFFFFSCIAIAMPQIFIDSFWKFFATKFVHGSFIDRYEKIFSALNAFLDRPLFGVGVGGMGPYYCQQYNAQGRDIIFHEPYLHMFETYDPANVGSELLASVGIVGLAAFGWMFYIYFGYFNKTAKISLLSQNEKSTIYGLIISICVMLVALQFNQNLFRSYIWVHLAIGLGYMFSIREKYEQRR